MMSQFKGKPNKGEAVCKSVGLNYGLWTKEETVSVVINYLTNKGISNDVWIGAFKNISVKTLDNADCEFASSSKVNSYLRWESAISTNLPAFMFPSSSSVKFNSCNQMKIFAKVDNGKILFEDGGKDSDKKFFALEKPVSYFSSYRDCQIHKT